MHYTLTVLAVLLPLSMGFAESFNYKAPLMDTGGKRTTLSAFANKGMLILYYSLECSKCREAVEILSSYQGKTCIPVVGVITGSEAESTFIKNKKRPFPCYYDKYKSMKGQFAIDHVPALFLVDEKGRVVFQKQKYYKETYRDLIDVLLRRFCPGPPFEKSMTRRYYGEAVCEPCHSDIHAWWENGAHAKQYEAAAQKVFGKSGYREGMAAKMGPALLKTSTVGFGEPGGYDPAIHQKSLLGVQCESCHGPGGPHGGGPLKNYEAKCIKCHDSATDPTFRYDAMLKKLNHPK